MRNPYIYYIQKKTNEVKPHDFFLCECSSRAFLQILSPNLNSHIVIMEEPTMEEPTDITVCLDISIGRSEILIINISLGARSNEGKSRRTVVILQYISTVKYSCTAVLTTPYSRSFYVYYPFTAAQRAKHRVFPSILETLRLKSDRNRKTDSFSLAASVW